MKKVDVLCYRDYTYGQKRDVTHSLLLTGVSLPFWKDKGQRVREKENKRREGLNMLVMNVIEA